MKNYEKLFIYNFLENYKKFSITKLLQLQLLQLATFTTCNLNFSSYNFEKLFRQL